jgi:hypothetical protein
VNQRTTEEQSKNNRIARWPLVCGDIERPSGFLACRYMTSFGIYVGDNLTMMNIELARILQSDREREIEADLRVRRLLREARPTEADCAEPRSIRSPQRPASTGAAAR